MIIHNLIPLSFIDVPQDVYVNGLLGIYEHNRIELLRDLFIWAYERSCAFYSTARKTLGEPDPFRMVYHNSIYEIVSEVVLHKLNKTQATPKIRKKADLDIPSKDQARFIEVVKVELNSLHEGNIARYRLRPSEFAVWQQIWT